MIAKNEYGNVDTSRGIPAGLRLLVWDSYTEQVARREGIDVARAIGGFRRQGRSWSPVVKGHLVEEVNAERLERAVFAARRWASAVARHESESSRALSAELPGV